MSSWMLEDEWNEGYDAWPCSLNKNPYPVGSDRANAWDEGWGQRAFEAFVFQC